MNAHMSTCVQFACNGCFYMRYRFRAFICFLLFLHIWLFALNIFLSTGTLKTINFPAIPSVNNRKISQIEINPSMRTPTISVHRLHTPYLSPKVNTKAPGNSNQDTNDEAHTSTHPPNTFKNATDIRKNKGLKSQYQRQRWKSSRLFAPFSIINTHRQCFI